MLRTLVCGKLLEVWVCADFDELPRDALRFMIMHKPYGEHHLFA